MMRILVLLLLLLICSSLGYGQAPGSNSATILLNGQTPPPITFGGAQVVGTPGTQTYFYWVVTTYPRGNSIPFGPIQVVRVPDTLSVTNYVNVTWNGVVGATSYDVLRTTTGTLPQGVAAIAVATGVTTTTQTDQSNVVSNYTINTATTSQTFIGIDNLNYNQSTLIYGSGGITPTLRANGVPTGSACVIGWEYFQLNATAGNNKWLCTGVNIWTQQIGAGVTGGVTAIPPMTIGTIPKAGTGTNLIDSIITESLGVITVGGDLRVTTTIQLGALDTVLSRVSAGILGVNGGVMTPIIIGGIATTSPLTLKSTTGVGAAGADIIFVGGTNGATELARILGGGAGIGNVGIGTATPNDLLHIKGSSSRLYLEGTNTSNAAAIDFAFDSSSTRRALIGGIASGTLGVDLVFYTKPNSAAGIVEVLRILSSGSTGIGPSNTAPTGTLHVRNATPTVGVTRSWIQEGDGQLASEVFGIYANNGTTLKMSFADGNLGVGIAPDSRFTVELAGLAAMRIGYGGTSNNYYDGDAHIWRNGSATEGLRLISGSHLIAGGTNPTITSGFGTSPAIAGEDLAGRITVGTGGIATTGTITFGTAWTTAPSCTVNNESTILFAQATATTTTLVITSATPFAVADKLSWTCFGY